MSRSYGTISSLFFDDPAARECSHDAWLVYVFLRCCKHSTAANAYVMPMAYLMHDLRMDEDRVLAAFNELSRRPFAYYDRRNQVVALPGIWREAHNAIANPSVAKRIAKLLVGLPDCELRTKAIEEFRMDCVYVQEAEPFLIGAPARDYAQGMLALPIMPIATQPAKRGKVKLASRLTEDWRPSTDGLKYAQSKGLSDEEIEEEIISFIRYWTREAKDSAKKDWDATWENRIDSVVKWKRERAARAPVSGYRNGNGNGHANTVVSTPWADRVADFRRGGMWIASWGPEPGKPGCKVPAEYLAPV